MTDPANTSVLSLPPTALTEYQAWLGTIKQRIVSVRLRMALSASRELIQFYWDLGALIAHKQAQSQWGDKLIAQLSADLQKAFPEIKGLSASKLKYCLRFFQCYTGGQGASDTDVATAANGQQPVDHLPWGIRTNTRITLGMRDGIKVKCGDFVGFLGSAKAVTGGWIK